MIYLVYGQDTYQTKKKVDEIAKQYSAHKVLDQEIEPEKIWNQLLQNQESLFGDPPLLIFRNLLDPLLGKEFFQKLQAILTRISSNKELIFWQEGLVDQRFNFIKWLLKEAEVIRLDPLRKPAVIRWIKNKLEGHQIEEPALTQLVDYHGNNLWILENELMKLVTYADGRKITVQDLELLSSKTVEENIFAFTDELSLKNKEKAGLLLNNLLQEGQDPNYLFSMIVRQFRLLLLSKTSRGLKNQHSFVVSKIKYQSPRWDFDQLQKIYQELLRIDAACKMGKSELEMELWLFLTRV